MARPVITEWRNILFQRQLNAVLDWLEENAVAGNTDAFGRLRIAQPETLFDSKQLFDDAPLYFDDSETSGSGTGSSHSTNKAATTMSCVRHHGGHARSADVSAVQLPAREKPAHPGDRKSPSVWRRFWRQVLHGIL
jgi:hypothetical protein